MKNLPILFTACLSLFLLSCSGKSPTEVIDGFADLFKETIPIIKSANDEASAKKAVSDLDDLIQRFDSFMAEHKDVKMSKEDGKKLKKRMYDVGYKVGMDCQAHIVSLRQTNPAAAKILEDGFQKFIKDFETVASKYQ